MPVSRELVLYEINNEVGQAVVYLEGTSTPQNLTGVTVELFIKDTSTALDASATKLSTATGEITITDAADGEISIVFPALASGVRWYRMDAIIAGQRKTASYGQLNVVNL